MASTPIAHGFGYPWLEAHDHRVDWILVLAGALIALLAYSSGVE